MKNLLRILLASLILCASLASCSSDKDKEEKGVIEQGTDKVAHEAVQAIKTPQEKAKIAAGQEDSHAKQIEEQTKQ